ncbi:hypothetical protein [Vibrio sp. CK2-1]|uniref:hypothetical protein n=1 Tax=Vibrio sp. CK2-1 TaxID=2912249 RepID=UPI001F3E70D9|nr:hypothetical protein [Vibrio sp. CK2-1]MCF7354897.1 hypothetical protein [Vibrio sp. CK2-1]
MKKTVVTVGLMSVILAGCGGSSDGGSDNNGGDNSGGNNTVAATGQFLDSAVQGISFVTASKSGNTDLAGTFGYNVGEKVTFSIGDLVFPTVTANKFITPLDLAGTTDKKDPEVINMVRLLMTLDTDSNPDNGITISSQAKQMAVPLDFNVSVDEFASSQDVLDFIANAGQQNPPTELVPQAEAETHFQKTLDDIDAIDTYADYVGMFNLEKNMADDSYTGIWNIYSDGSYLMIEYYNSEEDSGLEYGKLNLKNGGFEPDVMVDTDTLEDGGLSSGDWTQVSMEGDTLHVTKTERYCEEDDPADCTYELTTPRGVITGQSIVGSWERINDDGKRESYNFRDDGKYFFALIDDGIDQGNIEVGGYTFDPDNESLTLNITPDSDRSGASLLADDGVVYDIHSATLSEDGQSLTLVVDYNDGKDTTLILSRKL